MIKPFIKNLSFFFLLNLVFGVLLFLKQSNGLLPLIDWTYHIENSYRIFLGQIPYKDFYLVLTPGSYLLSALIMKFFGLEAYYQTLLIILMQSISLVLTFKVLEFFNKNKRLNIIFCLVLIPTGFLITPFPVYDVQAVFFMTLCLFVLKNIFLNKKVNFSLFILGTLVVIPALFKQNIGIPFAICSTLITLFVLKNKNDYNIYKSLTFYFLGITSVVSSFLAYLIVYSSFGNFIEQVFIFPGKTRNLVFNITEVGKSFLIGKTTWLFYAPLFSFFVIRKLKYIIFTISVIIVYLIIPIAGILLGKIEFGYLFKYYQYIYPSLMIFSLVTFLKVLINGNKNIPFIYHASFFMIINLVLYMSFISQRFYGSTYGTWPLLVMLIAFIYKYQKYTKHGLSIISITIFFVMTISSISNERLKFVDDRGIRNRSSSELFKGFETNGKWLPSLDMLNIYLNERVPKGDKVFIIPGEDPLYYMTGYEPQLKYFQLNINTFPNTIESIYPDIVNNEIKWVIIKEELQCPRGFINTKTLKSKIEQNYAFIDSVGFYKIYKSNDL